jgi:hypothetical protein
MRRSTNLTATGFAKIMPFPLMDSAQVAINNIANSQYFGQYWHQLEPEIDRINAGRAWWLHHRQ